jgi:hypothetical protein
MRAVAALRTADNPRLPQAEWLKVRVCLEQLAACAAESVTLFRPGMMQELEEAQRLQGAHLVHSMWTGYLDRER